MMDGRVKTLHPKVHGGLLAIRENPEHEAAMLATASRRSTCSSSISTRSRRRSRKGADYEDCIENIDIGGPAMIRAAAKNHEDVAVDRRCRRLWPHARPKWRPTTAAPPVDPPPLAQKAYARTAAYDAAISNWFAAALGEAMPAARAVGGKLAEAMRYGENPHQSAGFYHTGERAGRRHRAAGAGQAALLQQHQRHRRGLRTGRRIRSRAHRRGRHHQARQSLRRRRGPGLRQAYELALRLRPGLGLRRHRRAEPPLDAGAAREIVKIFTEVIIAPGGRRRGDRAHRRQEEPAPAADRRPARSARAGLTVRTVAGGLLVQGRDNAVVDDMELKVVTKRAPTDAELADLLFAFRVAKHVKSNAIVYAKDGATVGIGAGQMSRVDSSRIAAWKAAEAAKAAGLPEPLPRRGRRLRRVLPLRRRPAAAAEAGATAVIQPGGSMRDAEVIAAADEAGLAMVFTGHRHFRHRRAPESRSATDRGRDPCR
jgi:phosphoribosylaminoimidazolecarboxamide formyltransferase/IMP cyclohydrolase